MHFEILVEDQSEKRMLEILFPKIMDSGHTFRVIPHKGIGTLPTKVKDTKNIRTDALLNKLPRLLRGYGKAFSSYGSNYPAALVVVCDLDDKCLIEFKSSLNKILNSCRPKPKTCFCFAIEEGEAWFLGDIPAIKRAYPRVKANILKKYKNDTICGTEDLEKPLFKGVTKSNFKNIQVLYDGCAIGWEDLDIEIGMSRWVNVREVAA
ncbi:MAG: hypothetical protein JXA66_05145 [Oligoflexia bacterium]|nr:hypothetical protein [Oligoflexia bacterium]